MSNFPERCYCGFRHPGPMHGRECAHYDAYVQSVEHALDNQAKERTEHKIAALDNQAKERTEHKIAALERRIEQLEKQEKARAGGGSGATGPGSEASCI